MIFCWIGFLRQHGKVDDAFVQLFRNLLGIAAGDMIMQAGADFLELSDCGGQIPDLYKAALCWHISSCIFGFFHRAARPVSEMKRSGIELHCEHTAGREAVIRMI